jgi:hypothetical protein
MYFFCNDGCLESLLTIGIVHFYSGALEVICLATDNELHGPIISFMEVQDFVLDRRFQKNFRVIT